MATAIGTYATLANVKARIDDVDTQDDPELQRFCDFTNGWIESKTGRILAPYTLTAALFDGFDALEGGYLFPIPAGIRTISLLRIATTTGGAFSTIPASDYFVRPTAQERDPGWPGMELWMTDIPSATNAVPYFPPGYANVEITTAANGAGWAAQPDEIVGIAEKIVVVAWQLRGSGEGNAIGTDAIGVAVRTALDGSDWHTLQRYSIKSVEIV